MHILRRTLGILVMIAGILGLLLAIAGLVLVWVGKPTLTTYADNTINMLTDSATTSQSVMVITGQALGATVDSLDALSSMLATTADTVDDTAPVVSQVTLIMSDTLPSTFEATTASLHTAQEAAVVLESTIKSLDSFRFLLSGVPLLSGILDQPGTSYNPEVSLAQTLGDLAEQLEGLPDTFVSISTNLSTTDDNLGSIQTNLMTMSDSVLLISSSLGDYERMLTQSQTSMDNLKTMLTNLHLNLASILNALAIGMTLFLLWLLTAQIVIFSQGWELFQGTADRMESNDE
jgi:hypothetical protein